MDTGQAGRDDGIARAAHHADAVFGDWNVRALEQVHRAAMLMATFTVENVSDYAYTHGTLPAPPEPRAWGAVMVKAAEAGWIERAGYETSKHVRAHCRPVTLWRSLVRVTPS